jgi:hypothetical protein
MAHDTLWDCGPESTSTWNGTRWVPTGVTREQAEANRERRLGRTPEWHEARALAEAQRVAEQEMRHVMAERRVAALLDVAELHAEVARFHRAERRNQQDRAEESSCRRAIRAVIHVKERTYEPGARSMDWMAGAQACVRPRMTPHLAEERDESDYPGELLERAWELE